VTSKDLFRMSLLCIVLAGSTCQGSAGEVTLPEGSAPAPIVVQHFPDRLYAFVWRNWNLVEPARMAKLLGASEPNVLSMAASMGLPAAVPVPPEVRTRGYITILRRNWHLLPYEQLLERKVAHESETSA
jgi:hypothetical protein